MRWRLPGVLLGLGMMMLPVRSDAKLCGDDVDGQDVPCACGDTLVSSVALGSDPVLDAPCEQDALIVRAGAAATGPLRIDLQGKTLRGSGHGTGLWVVFGGSGGAQIVSSGGRATIEGFRDGVVSHGPDTVALVDGVNVAGSVRDGIRLMGPGFEVKNSEVRGSGRDAFSVGGGGFRITSTRAIDNKRFGYFVMGQDAVIGEAGAGNVAERNGGEGFSIMGMGHRLVECSASGSGKDGIHLNTMHVDLRGSSATGSGGSGIAGMAPGSSFTQNTGNDNDNDGIHVGGPGLVDGGGNSGNGNRGQGRQRPAAQCEIGGAPCRP